MEDLNKNEEHFAEEAQENEVGQQTALSPEEKLAKFKEIGARRVSKACKAIRILGNLSNRNSYAYEQIYVDKMFEAIEAALAETKVKFQEEKDFSFD
jgi:hypothetical protein